MVSKVVDNTNNSFMTILKGVLISFILTLVLVFIFALILTYTNVQESAIFPAGLLITAISILIGSSISTIKIKKNGILNGGIIGFIYILLIYLISSIIGTGFALNLNSILIILAGVVGGMLGGIVGVNIK